MRLANTQSRAATGRRRAAPSSRRGATALEFAIVAPVFMLLMCLVIEVAWQLTVDLALNIGLFLGSRYGITGAGGNARDSTIRGTIVSSTGGILRDAKLSLTTKAYASPGAYASGGAGTAGTGLSGQLVVYTATYQQDFITPWPTTFMGVGPVTHTAQMVVQNEPF